MSEKLEDVLALIGGYAIFGAEMAMEGAKPLTEKLSREMRAMLEEIRTDIDAVRARDPAARSDIEVLLLYSGVHALLAYRVAHKLYLSEHYFSARLVSSLVLLTQSSLLWLKSKAVSLRQKTHSLTSLTSSTNSAKKCRITVGSLAKTTKSCSNLLCIQSSIVHTRAARLRPTSKRISQSARLPRTHLLQAQKVQRA